MKILRSFILSLALLCSACSMTKNISNQAPYDQCIGKKFVLKEDMYIFKFNDTSLWSIATQHSGIVGLPPLVDKKYLEDQYFGKNNQYLTIKEIVAKGSIFTVVKVNYEQNIESSHTYFLIAFETLPAVKNWISASAIMNFDNPPYTSHWSDPPIFEAKFAEPLPSDGIWWK